MPGRNVRSAIKLCGHQTYMSVSSETRVAKAVPLAMSEQISQTGTLVRQSHASLCATSAATAVGTQHALRGSSAPGQSRRAWSGLIHIHGLLLFGILVVSLGAQHSFVFEVLSRDVSQILTALHRTYLDKFVKSSGNCRAHRRAQPIQPVIGIELLKNDAGTEGPSRIERASGVTVIFRV
jgi:hypothetical protein